jgi:hypothetical protein
LAALRTLGAIGLLWAWGSTAVPAQTPETAIPLPSNDDLHGGSNPERYLFFGGFDIWRFGYTGYTGLQWAPGALHNDGFVLSVFMSDGLERYDAATTQYRTAIFRASILPGWRFKRSNLEVKAFAGLDFERDDFSPVPTSGPSFATHLGARTAFDLWWEASPTLMMSAAAAMTTIANGYSARAAAGLRTFGASWIGPEISTSADRFSKQYRIGAHITGLKTATLEWSFAAGYVQDNMHRSGAYGRISVLTRR